MAGPVHEAAPAPAIAAPAVRSPARGWPWLDGGDPASAPAGFAIPWASWARRVCERAGVTLAADSVTAAVAAVCTRGADEAPDDLARCALAARILGRFVDLTRVHAWLLLLGDHEPAAAPHNPTDAQRRRGSRSGTREALALWTAPALAAGEELEPWARFGEAAAEPIWLLDGLTRLWLEPGSADLERAALTPLLAAWLGSPELEPSLLRALAGERASPSRRSEIHGLLASGAFRERVAAAAKGSLDRAREALPRRSDGLGAAGAELIDALAGRFRFFDSVMAFRDLLSPARKSRSAPSDDLRAAVAWLVESAPWAESWEVQRFGVFGSEEQPVGHWFVRGTVLLSLLELGHGDPAAAAALLREIPEGELRYYGAWRGIPPDADDLGLMLQLAAAIGEAGPRIESWIDVMTASAGEDGVVPTWFYQGPSGPTVTAPPGSWAGDDCAAVRLHLLAGLVSFDAARFDRLIRANLRSVLARVSGGEIGGSYFYDAATAALAFLRFARLYRGAAAADRLGSAARGLAAAVAAAERDIRGHAAKLQRLDGGWGTPQSTAARLEGCAISASDPLLLERGARSLGEAQLCDGSWPAEPLYRTPFKDGRVGYHQGRALTTALCARALGAAIAASSRQRGA